MSAAQVHLMLNHVPVLGVCFVIVTLAAGMMFRSRALARLGLALLVGVALSAIPVFFSGEPAEELIEDAPGVAETSIEAHETAAKSATIVLGILGLLALVPLVRKGAEASRPYTSVMLILLLGLSGLMAWTAHLGGSIRHPEIRAGASLQTAENADLDADAEAEDDD